MAKAKQPVNITDGVGIGIEFDALIDEEAAFESDVPTYPVERGFEISDGIIIKPQRLSMTLFVGISVTWVSRFGSNIMRAQEVEQKLKELYFRREPVTVVTTDGKYENMAITSVTFRKSVEVGYAKEFPISFQEVRITQTQTTAIPAGYGRSGATGVNAGAANVTMSQTPPGSTPPNGFSNWDSGASVLYNLTYGGGLKEIAGGAGDLIGSFIGGGG